MGFVRQLTHLAAICSQVFVYCHAGSLLVEEVAPMDFLITTLIVTVRFDRQMMWQLQFIVLSGTICPLRSKKLSDL